MPESCRDSEWTNGSKDSATHPYIITGVTGCRRTFAKTKLPIHRLQLLET